MNTYSIYDEEYTNSFSYQNFLEENPSEGKLRIRAYAASEAVPIKGLKIVISKIIDNNNVIFFEGYTDESGLIEEISLPAPALNIDNLIKPLKTTYDIKASYLPDNIMQTYSVNIYENICVIQNIIIVPESNIETREFNGY